MRRWFRRAGGRSDGHSSASEPARDEARAGRSAADPGDARSPDRGSPTRYVDLGPAADDPAAKGLLVVLPGRGYHPDKPLLAVATQVAVDRGWRVRQVWWHASDDADEAWAGAELRSAAQGSEGAVRVLGKSLGSRAAPAAAVASYPSCWLTPLLQLPPVVEGIRANPASQLLVGGSADEAWNRTIADELPGEVVELPGADHSLNVRGDKNATATAHAEFVRAFGAWLG